MAFTNDDKEKLKLNVDIVGTKLFNRMALLISNLYKDERIPYEVRDEIGKEVYEMMQCN